MTYHVARSWESEDLKILHGKTAMAKLFASEMAGRVATGRYRFSAAAGT